MRPYDSASASASSSPRLAAASLSRSVAGGSPARPAARHAARAPSSNARSYKTSAVRLGLVPAGTRPEHEAEAFVGLQLVVELGQPLRVHPVLLAFKVASTASSRAATSPASIALSPTPAR